MSVDWDKFSLVQWFPESEYHKCGYCKNPKGSISDGMWADQLNVEDYQELIDRGWRRSGKYCYKPVMDKTCCPQYPIKCDAMNFSLNKSHKKVIKKFNKFIDNGIINKNDISHEDRVEGVNETSLYHQKDPQIQFNKNMLNQNGIQFNINMNKGEPCGVNEKNSDKKKETDDIKSDVFGVEGKICDKHLTNSNCEASSKLKSNIKAGVGIDESKPPCKKAKIIRLERKKEKLLKKGIIIDNHKSAVNAQKSLEEFLDEISPTSKHKLKLKLIATSKPTAEWDIVSNVEFELYKKYQMIIHNDPEEKLTMKGFTRFLVTSPLKITTEKMDRSHKSFELTAALYKKYQINIHNDQPDDCTEKEFEAFLVQTPLKPKVFPGGVDGPGYGSFHQQYWIDDKLVAVAVIDILPKCVSSVYFFYDPDYRALTLGTYGSLRELQFVRSLHAKVPSIKNYIMGFYIHSCPKMRYKGKLVPSFLVCPETYVWIPIEKCLPKLEANKYSRLNEDVDAIDQDACSERDIGDMKVIDSYKIYYFRDYVQLESEQKEVFEKIGKLIGNKCAKRIVFWIK